MPSVLPRILASLADQAIQAFDLAVELSHPGESGRAREETIRRFLAAVVPPDFGVDTGFVIDAAGGISRQIDIVIYRKQQLPVLEIGGVRHFMVESVAAVVEVKAVVGSRQVLNDALDNIESVKSLDRSNGGHNRVVGIEVPVNPSAFQHQIWGAVATGRSMVYGTCLEAMVDWVESKPRSLWPNGYVDIKEFLITYASGSTKTSSPTRMTTDPQAADAMSGVEGWDHPWGRESPLAYFALELMNFLRVTPVINYQAYTDLNSHPGYFYSTRHPKETYYRFDSDSDA